MEVPRIHETKQKQNETTWNAGPQYTKWLSYPLFVTNRQFHEKCWNVKKRVKLNYFFHFRFAGCVLLLFRFYFVLFLFRFMNSGDPLNGEDTPLQSPRWTVFGLPDIGKLKSESQGTYPRPGSHPQLRTLTHSSLPHYAFVNIATKWWFLNFEWQKKNLRLHVIIFVIKLCSKSSKYM